MRFALHMATLNGLGSAQVGQGILAGLAALDQTHDWLVHAPASWNGHLDLGPRFVHRPARAGLLGKLVVENLALRSDLGRWAVHALFSCGDTSLPACPVPHLLLVQQAYLAYEPADWGFVPDARSRARFALMARYFALGLSTVTRFTVQTQDMKQRLAARWRLPLDDIHVVPSAVAVDDAIALAPRDPLSPPFIACASGRGPHKNLAVLADLMAALPPSLEALVLKVAVTPEHAPDLVARARRLKVERRIELLGSLPRSRALALLRGAQVVVIPSLIESFGFAYHEAMACGCAIVAADRSFAREACGDAALYAPAHDGAAFAGHISRIFEDSKLSRDLQVRARTRYLQKNVTWAEVAAGYLKILEESAR